MRAPASAFVPLALCALACEVDLERMLDQNKYEAYEPSPWFANGQVLQHPPRGTVHRGAVTGPEPLVRGTSAGQFVTTSPLAVDEALLARGQDRFRIFCQTCHGVLGDGQSQVAENMSLRKPPSLHEPRIRDYPIGRLYQVIANGYGLMPSYATELSVEDRWAVANFVQALQLSQNVRLAELPERWQQEAGTWLR